MSIRACLPGLSQALFERRIDVWQQVVEPDGAGMGSSGVQPSAGFRDVVACVAANVAAQSVWLEVLWKKLLAEVEEKKREIH